MLSVTTSSPGWASGAALKQNPQYTEKLIRQALINTDDRIHDGKSVTPAFLFAALLWPALPARVLQLQNKGMPPIPAMQEAAHELIAEQCQRIAIPKRFTMPIREIWDMQERLPRRSGKRADLLLDNPRFRAGYDFLLLRESAGEQTDGLGEWWTDYQDANDSERRDMIRDLSGKEDTSGALQQATDARVLLGEPSRSTFYNWRNGKVSTLSRDTLERVSYIAGIYKALHLLFPQPDQANAWLKKPNSAFAGQSALDVMLAGSIVDLARVRRYLDAQRG